MRVRVRLGVRFRVSEMETSRELEPPLPVERERCSAACISSSSCEIEMRSR